jgi:hypothetical protein
MAAAYPQLFLNGAKWPNNKKFVIFNLMRRMLA